MSDFKKAMIKRANVKRDREIKQQERMDKLSKRLGMKTSAEYLRERKDELEYDYNNTPIEKRQQFLDLMHAGKKLGEAREIVGLSLDVAAEIYMRHLKTITIGLEDKAKE